MGKEEMIILWLVGIILFSLIEAATLGLSTIWFAIGAIVALIAALLNLSFLVQFVLFILVSLVLLTFTRPIFVKYLHVGRQKTNLDAIVGSIAIVTKDISPHKFGQVKLNGQIWTATSEHRNQTILKDTEVEVVSIEGVKLIVKNFKEE